MSATPPKWKRFENLVAEIQRSLSGDAAVTQNERIRGKTGALREVDISIRQDVAQFKILVVIDCKDYQVPVDVKDVEAFAGLLEDVGANKGAMVAANGFTSTAKNLARTKGIDLFRLLDTQSIEWASYVTVPALVRNLRLRWRVVFEGRRSEIEHLALTSDTQLFEADGTSVGTIREQVHILWKYAVLSEEPGRGSISPPSGQSFFVRFEDTLIRVAPRIETEVWYDWYLGEIPLTTVRGLVNEVDGSFKTNQFETDWLHFVEVEKHWQHIESPKELSIRPIITFLLKDAPADDPDAARSMRVSIKPSRDPSG